MKPVMQTKRGGSGAPPEERGDCLAACLASLLEVPIEDVPVPHNPAGPEGVDSGARIRLSRAIHPASPDVEKSR